MKLGEPSLDQLRIFLTIVDEGSFGGAARRMGRAISAISYGITQMEAMLGISLFYREGSRKPVLTDAGRGILAEARAVVDRSDGLLAKTQSLHEGLESSVGLALDVMVPGEASARVLREFREHFPTVSLRLQIEALGALAACLLSEESDLAIGGPVISDRPEFERRAIGEVALLPVASPSHPLAVKPAKPGESREHLQLVLTDRSSLTDGREFSVFSPLNWRLGDLGAKHALLRQGIGWGNMPDWMIEADLQMGSLTVLDLPEKPGADYTLSAMWRRDTVPGRAATWLIEAFENALCA
ncbi:MAG: LysR family transcriptional regulator [Pseudomonadota bacterium]